MADHLERITNEVFDFFFFNNSSNTTVAVFHIQQYDETHDANLFPLLPKIIHVVREAALEGKLGVQVCVSLI